MICSKCNKEAIQGKVDKGKFVCNKCGAAAIREAWENQVVERHKRIGQMIERTQAMIHTVIYDMAELSEFMRSHGMTVTKEAEDA